MRERAVRLVLDNEAQYPSRWQAVVSIAAKIGCTPQTLNDWAKKAEVDSGRRAGIPTEMADRMKALERENRELRQANEILRTSKRLGRTIWRRWSEYHRRSRAETKMHCVKLLGQRLSAREFDRQVAEFQVRVAVLNGFTALGIPETEAVG